MQQKAILTGPLLLRPVQLDSCWSTEAAEEPAHGASKAFYSTLSKVTSADPDSGSPVRVLMAEGGARTIFIIINGRVTRGKVGDAAAV